MRRLTGILLVAMAAVAMLFPAALSADESITQPQIRAFWVDAFHDGAKTPGQIDKLVDDCLAANINTIIVQVRRRGDAYYNISPLDPRTEDLALPPGFDALQYLIDKAHPHSIEVHAWLNTLVAWNSSAYPRDSRHMWNTHGPKAPLPDNWVSYYRTLSGGVWSEKVYQSYYIDPGHPDAVDYTTEVYLNVVRNYDVDGIHLDYSRYAGTGWGYNPTSIARFNARYGRTGMPLPTDPLWSDWRREQTSLLSRKIYLGAVAIKPNIKVSSATIAWSGGPITTEDWTNCRAYNEVYQDWRAWLEEGTLDIAMPMNYDREWNADQKLWYDQWIEWEKNHQYNRSTAIGPALYLQYPEMGLDQLRRALAPSQQGNFAAGVCLYSYGSTSIYGCDDYKDPDSPASKALPRQPQVFSYAYNDMFYPLLSHDGEYPDPRGNGVNYACRSVFAAPAPIPEMPWKTRPAKGHLMGFVADFTGKTYERLKVFITGPETREVYTDGNGWFGAVDLLPGHYQLTIGKEDFVGRRLINVWIVPGFVSPANFNQFWLKGSSGFGCQELDIDYSVEAPDPFDEAR